MFSHHGLRGSASPVLTATGFDNGRGQISTPHRIHAPWPITQKFVASDNVGEPYGCAEFRANPSTGGFRANGWNYFLKFISLYLFSGTHLQLSPVDGFSRLKNQTTRTRARCAFRGFVNTAPHFGGEIAPKPPFLGVKPNRQNIGSFTSLYRNYCIDFNQIFHNDRDHQVVIIGKLSLASLQGRLIEYQLRLG